jgi:hypothetical protein
MSFDRSSVQAAQRQRIDRVIFSGKHEAILIHPWMNLSLAEERPKDLVEVEQWL